MAAVINDYTYKFFFLRNNIIEKKEKGVVVIFTGTIDCFCFLGRVQKSVVIVVIFSCLSLKATPNRPDQKAPTAPDETTA